jgi:chromosomal replication initiator protein
MLTSDRVPRELDRLHTRLRDRFDAGLVAEIEPPDIATRMAVLRKHAAHGTSPLPTDDAMSLIAEHVTTNLRALEGALVRVVAYASLKSERPSPELARRVLATLYPLADGPRLSLDAIQRAAAEEFGVPAAALLAQDRRPGVAFARQVAMYLARELTDESLPAIGARFGGRNHSTVLHAHRKIASDLQRDDEVVHKVDALRRRLENDPS